MNTQKILTYVKNPMRAFVKLGGLGFFNWMSDETYLKIAFHSLIGKKLDLKHPQTFNEKLQWLKLYDRKPIYTTMVDKYEAKKYVANILGEQYIIPTLGVWDKFEDIDFDKLPSQFVLKCTHDSGGLVICRDKSKFDIEAARKKISRSLKRNYFWQGREWPYKDVKPRIIAEKYLTGDLPDYKFMCFNGEPRAIQFCNNRFTGKELTMTYYDVDWKKLPFEREGHPNTSIVPPPPQLDKMRKLAEILSKDIPFVRIDLYENNQQLYFGEMTLYPGSGFPRFTPEEWDKIVGDWIKLSNN